jgi:hypothetical protein
MKPWTTWLARLGIAGACLIVTGCGGGDVPDASSDGQAATEGASGGVPSPAAASSAGPKVAANDDQAAKADEPAAEPAAPAQAQEPESPPASAKAQESKGNSKTAEMLAMATGPSAGSSSPPADDSAPPAGGSTNPPADTPAPGGSAASGGQGGRPGGPGAGGPGKPGMGGPPQPNGQGQAMANAQAQQAARQKQMAAQGNPGGSGPPGGPGGGAMGRPGGPGAQGGPGANGAAGVDNAPADFHSPQGAVRAFLNALKAKDLDRLNEATALRAQVEATAKNQGLFKKIFELSLSDSELDELSKKLEGYRIAGENPAQSTARVDVILQKQDPNSNGGYFRRKVTVRHEKKGWGVLDIAGATEFKPPIGSRPRPNTGSGRGNN